jgi:hypothetical protein
MSFLSASEIWAVAAAVGIAFCGACRIVENRKWAQLPPSPPRDPFIGNLRHIPQENQKKVFEEWGKIYGKSHSIDMALIAYA